MIEFSLEDYRLAGHLEPWYEFYSGLGYLDLEFNPYGFMFEERYIKKMIYAKAKSVTKKAIKKAANTGEHQRPT